MKHTGEEESRYKRDRTDLLQRSKYLLQGSTKWTDSMITDFQSVKDQETGRKQIERMRAEAAERM